MPSAPDYVRAVDFTPGHNGPGLNSELDTVGQVFTLLNDNIKLIQRDDGELRDLIVKKHTIHPETVQFLIAELTKYTSKLYAEFTRSTLKTDISNTATQIRVDKHDVFPDPGTEGYYLRLTRRSDGATEVVNVTNKIGNAFTIKRVMGLVNRNSFSAGDIVSLWFTPTGVTQPLGTSNNSYATTEFVINEISSVPSAPIGHIQHQPSPPSAKWVIADGSVLNDTAYPDWKIYFDTDPDGMIANYNATCVSIGNSIIKSELGTTQVPHLLGSYVGGGNSPGAILPSQNKSHTHQASAAGEHSHKYTKSNVNGTGPPGYGGGKYSNLFTQGDTSNASSHTHNITQSGGTKAFPQSIILRPYIKVIQ